MTSFQGPLRRSESLEDFITIPTWMQPGEAEFSTGVFAFIRLTSGEHFEGALFPKTGPENHDPHPHGPVICEIRIGEFQLFKTEPFELYVPTHIHYPELPCYPPPNRVYITMRGGPIYSAVLLAPHQLAMTHNKLRIETASLEDLTPSTSQSQPRSSKSQAGPSQTPRKAAKTGHSSHPR